MEFQRYSSLSMKHHHRDAAAAAAAADAAVINSGISTVTRERICLMSLN